MRLWRTASTASTIFIPAELRDLESVKVERQHVEDSDHLSAYGNPVRAHFDFYNYGSTWARCSRFVVEVFREDLLRMLPVFGYGFVLRPEDEDQEEIREQLGLGPKW